MSQKIILHIGHGKTGSSAIQSVLARNQRKLREHGILYPTHRSFDQAAAGHISSGNIDLEDWLGQILAIARDNPDCPTLLFSNEVLFCTIQDSLEAIARRPDGHAFEILLFVRHPLEMLDSAYQQAVKREGFTGSIVDYSRREVTTIRASAMVDRFIELGIDFRLFNYSALRRGVVESFLAYLGLTDLIDDREAWRIGTVNRSLTLGELRFVRDVNRIFGAQYGAPISDTLVNHLPDIRADRVPIDARTAAELREREYEPVVNLNRHLPADQQLSLLWEERLVAADAQQELSAEQAQVIRGMFPGALVHADGPILRTSRCATRPANRSAAPKRSP